MLINCLFLRTVWGYPRLTASRNAKWRFFCLLTEQNYSAWLLIHPPQHIGQYLSLLCLTSFTKNTVKKDKCVHPQKEQRTGAGKAFQCLLRRQSSWIRTWKQVPEDGIKQSRCWGNQLQVYGKQIIEAWWSPAPPRWNPTLLLVEDRLSVKLNAMYSPPPNMNLADLQGPIIFQNYHTGYSHFSWQGPKGFFPREKPLF